MIKKLNILFLTFFMIGKIKYAPGTIASFFTCILFFILIKIFNFNLVFFLTLFIFLYSFVAINNSFDEFDSEDPQEIVIDEVVGQMLVLLAIPIYETLPGWQTSTFGLNSWDELPKKAQDYINFLESKIEKRISIISTGPDRIHTIDRNNLLSNN